MTRPGAGCRRVPGLLRVRSEHLPGVQAVIALRCPPLPQGASCQRLPHQCRRQVRPMRPAGLRLAVPMAEAATTVGGRGARRRSIVTGPGAARRLEPATRRAAVEILAVAVVAFLVALEDAVPATTLTLGADGCGGAVPAAAAAPPPQPA